MGIFNDCGAISVFTAIKVSAFCLLLCIIKAKEKMQHVVAAICKSHKTESYKNNKYLQRSLLKTQKTMNKWCSFKYLLCESDCCNFINAINHIHFPLLRYAYVRCMQCIYLYNKRRTSWPAIFMCSRTKIIKIYQY